MELSRRALLASVPASAGAVGLGSRAVGGTDVQTNWEPLGRLRLTGATEAVVEDETAYVATVDGFAIVDVSDPTSPEVVAERREFRVADGELLEGDETDGEDGEGNETAGADDGGAGEDGGPDGNETDETDDSVGDEDSPRRFTEILDLSVEGDRLVVPGPANPGQDAFSGFALYDVGDPREPQPLAIYETGFHIHNATLEGGYCYLVGNDGERNPLVIVDVGGDDPREVGRWSLLEHEPRWAETDPFLWYLHDVTLSGNIAILAYWNAGTYLVDVRDPANPEYVGHVAETDVSDQVEVPPTGITEAQQTLPGNDHHARLAGDLLAVGREAWAAEAGDPEGSGGIDLYDASDPAKIEHLATIEAPETEDASYRGGEWTTSHNFTVRDDRLYASWYRGGVSVHDVSDPGDPGELARWEDRERAAFWTAHAAEEVVVAPSTPLVPNAPSEGALYTFPASPDEESADGEDGGAVTADDEDGDGGGDDGTEIGDEDEGGPDGDGTGTGTEGEGANDGGNGTETVPEEGNESADDADGGRNGLGIGAAVAGSVAVGGAAVLAWLRLRGSGGSDGTGEDAGDR